MQNRTFITLDDLQIRMLDQDYPIAFLRGSENSVIDEIEHTPNVTLELKRTDDQRPELDRFLITDSVYLFRSSMSRDSFAGHV